MIKIFFWFNINTIFVRVSNILPFDTCTWTNNALCKSHCNNHKVSLLWNRVADGICLSLRLRQILTALMGTTTLITYLKLDQPIHNWAWSKMSDTLLLKLSLYDKPAHSKFPKNSVTNYDYNNHKVSLLWTEAVVGFIYLQTSHDHTERHLNIKMLYK